jgi:hypothetical protein
MQLFHFLLEQRLKKRYFRSVLLPMYLEQQGELSAKGCWMEA